MFQADSSSKSQSTLQVLQNLTNQNTPSLSPQSHKSGFPSNTLAQKLQESQNSKGKGKNNNLQQENQVLKSQISLLKQTLIGLCQDQKMVQKLPAGVLFQLQSAGGDLQLQNLVGILSSQQQSPQKSQQSNRRSPQKDGGLSGYQTKVHREESPIKQQENQYQISLSSNKKASISGNRRRRCDRVTTPSNQGTLNKLQLKDLEQQYMVTPLAEEMRSIVQEEGSGVQGSEQSQQQWRRGELTTSRVKEYQLDSNRETLKCRQEDVLVVGEERDASQLHIKYVKMLEELEKQSEGAVHVDSKILEVDTSSKAHLGELPLSIIHKEATTAKKRSNSHGVGAHSKNKHSCQFEQKQFYEYELQALKSELQQFEQEEEKILSIIKSSKNLSLDESKENSSRKQSHRQDEEEGECKEEVMPIYGKELPTAGRESECPILSQKELMLNLEEASLFLRQTSHLDDEEKLLKPIKITSPKNKLETMEEQPLRQAKVEQVKESRNLIEQREISNKTPKPYKLGGVEITPVRSQVSGTISCDRKRQLSRHEDDEGSKHQKTENEKRCVSGQKVKGKAGIGSKNKRRKSKMGAAAKGNQFSMFTSTKEEASPSKQKAEARYNISTNPDDFEEEPFQAEPRDKKLTQLELLSKRQSLAQGLKQQEEPLSDDEGQSSPVKQLPEMIPEEENYASEEQEAKNIESKLDGDLVSISNYYGIYSKEKSEELKLRRCESIKKAEELLSQFIIQKCQRPYFVSDILTQPVQMPISKKEEVKYISDKGKEDHGEYNTYIVEESNCRIIEEGLVSDRQEEFAVEPEVKVKELINFNEISFQNQDMCQVSFLKNSSKNSTLHSRQGSSQHQFLNIEIPALLKSPPKRIEHGIQELSKEQEELYAIEQQLNESQRSGGGFCCNQIVKGESHSPFKSNHFIRQETNMNQRRKSHEQCKPQSQCMSQQKKSKVNLSKKKIDQVSPIGSQYRQRKLTNQLNQTSSHAAIQRYNWDLTHGGVCPRQLEDLDHSAILPQAAPGGLNGTFAVDPEVFYEKRSKSVIKRREELLRKKEELNRSKIEAKYQKIEQLRQTRNQKMIQTRFMGAAKKQRNLSRCKNLEGHTYGGQWGKTEDIDEAYLEIKAGAYASNNARANQEERRVNIDHTQTNITNDSTVAHPNVQCGASISTTNCKSSVLISECSSFRQFEQKQFGQHLQKSGSKPTPNNIAHQKGQSCLKQNIINKTLKMHQNKSRQNPNAHGMQPSCPGISQVKKNQSTLEMAYQDAPHRNYTYSDKSTTLDSTLHSTSQISCKLSHNMTNSSSQHQKLVSQKGTCSKERQLNSQRTAKKGQNENVYLREGSSHKRLGIVERNACMNCQRLMAKGLSTDFCLNHINTPKIYD